jgi:hypothetical protein
VENSGERILIRILTGSVNDCKELKHIHVEGSTTFSETDQFVLTVSNFHFQIPPQAVALLSSTYNCSTSSVWHSGLSGGAMVRAAAHRSDDPYVAG